MKDIEGGFLLIDKPSGITSFDCIRRLRGVLDSVKMGHAGTLDPLATGLMVIGVGKKGTKALNGLKDADKRYEVTALMGVKTATGDTDGEVTERKDVRISAEDAEREVKGLKGEQELEVPIYSAVKRKGKPLYWYARKDMTVELPKKIMSVKEVDFQGMYNEGEDTRIKFSVKVSSGTYVRSLVEELGERLSTVATVSALRRTLVGDYSIDEAVTLNEAGASDVIPLDT